MPSPFPGMDPYLEDEAQWPSFHYQFMQSLHQILQPSLIDRYRARINQRHYVIEQALFTSVVREEHHEDYLEIRQRSDGRLVTLVEVVSPANKQTSAGRTAYLAKRDEGKSVKANLVEIDLVLQGQPTLEYSREGLPDWDYAITVTRATQPDRYEIYTTTLQKRLPRFRLPLASDDRDTVLDLHTAFTRCYDQGGFAAKIDYRKDPSTPLSDEDRKWLHELLKQQKLR
jgi:predicted transcriptional regulator